MRRTMLFARESFFRSIANRFFFFRRPSKPRGLGTVFPGEFIYSGEEDELLNDVINSGLGFEL